MSLSLKQVDPIGLNLKCDNAAAIKIFRDLGFQPTACYFRIYVGEKRISEQPRGD